jgi:two-component system, response regulator
MMRHQHVILLVDDNPDFVELAKRALAKANIVNPLVVAEDGVQALDYLFGSGAWAERDTADTPVLVLLDLKLPKIDGLEVLRRMRDDPRTKLVPVVILTTSSEQQDILSGYGLGANSYIRKPVDFNELAEVLKQAGTYWLMINEPPRLEGGK